MKHIQNCLTFMSDHDRHHQSFGNFDTPEVREECRKQHVNVESLRFFIPFVIVVWYNDKGRIQLNEEPIREPHDGAWITTSMDDNDVDALLRHDGTYRTTNVFFRAQSGHSSLREDQRAKLGPPYDFRHNILMHKTTEHTWNQMKSKRGSRKLEARERDIHLVPVEFLYHDPESTETTEKDFYFSICMIPKQEKLFPPPEKQRTGTFWFLNTLTSDIWKQSML